MGALSLWPLAIPGAFTHLVIQHMFIEHQLQSTLEQLRIGGGMWECQPQPVKIHINLSTLCIYRFPASDQKYCVLGPVLSTRSAAMNKIVKDTAFIELLY